MAHRSTETEPASRRTLQAARRSRSLAVARDVLRDVFLRWDRGLMGRGRWLWLGPLTAVLAGAAWQDVAQAVGPVDRTGRVLTAAALTALHLNVAAKRLRDLRLGGWMAAAPINAGLAGLHAIGFGGALTISYLIVLFLLPGTLARSSVRLARRATPQQGP
jgi:hypothetical protein